MSQQVEERDVTTFGEVKVASGRIVDDGAYKVRLDAIKIVPNQFYGKDPEKPGAETQYRFDMTVADDEHGEPVKLRTWAPNWGYLSPKQKAGKVIGAFLGREIVEGETVTPRDVLGKLAIAIATIEVNAQGGEYNKVTDVKPLRSAARKTAKPAEDPEELDIPL